MQTPAQESAAKGTANWGNPQAALKADTASVLSNSPLGDMMHADNVVANTIFHKGIGRAAITAAILAHDDTDLGPAWTRAGQLQSGGHTNSGTDWAAAADVWLHPDTTPQNLDNLRQNNTIYNLTGLAANTVLMAADPAVIATKVASHVIEKGVLGYAGHVLAKSTDGVTHLPIPVLGRVLDSSSQKTARVQLDVLTQDDADSAAAKAESLVASSVFGTPNNLATRVRTAGAMQMYQKIANLRQLALSTDASSFADYIVRNRTFSANQHAAALLMWHSAADDGKWNLFKNMALGDPTAAAKIEQLGGEHADLIAAARGDLNFTTANYDLESTLRKHQQLWQDKMNELDAQGVHPETADQIAQAYATEHAALDKSPLTDPGLDQEIAARQAKLNEYTDYQDWLQKVMPSLGEAGGNAANSIFNTMNRLPGGIINPLREQIDTLIPKKSDDAWTPNPAHLADRGGSVSTFLKSPFSAAHQIFYWGKKESLHRVGWADAHDLEQMHTAVGNFIKQGEHIIGSSSDAAKSRVIVALHNASGETDRINVMQGLEKEFMGLILKKHGVSQSAADELSAYFERKKSGTIALLKNRAQAPFMGGDDASMIHLPDQGSGLTSTVLPVSPTQLQNYHVFVNPIDFEQKVKDNLKSLRQYDEWNATRYAEDGSDVRPNPVVNPMAEARQFVNHLGDSFNRLWKPDVLLSLRWPLKMAQDEAIRAALLMGWGNYGSSVLGGTARGIGRGVASVPAFFRGGKFAARGADDGLIATGDKTSDWRDWHDPQRMENLDIQNYDKGAHEKLGKAVSMRAQHKSNNWQDNYSTALDAATKGGTRPGGVVISPTSFRVLPSDGYIVSPMRGKMESLGTRPDADYINGYMGRHARDLAALPNARVAAWYDNDLQHWVVDTVSYFKKDSHATALKFAHKANAWDVIDTGESGGWARYLKDGDSFNRVQNTPFSLYDSELNHEAFRNADVSAKPSIQGYGRGAVFGKNADTQRFVARGGKVFGGGTVRAPGLYSTAEGSLGPNYLFQLHKAAPMHRSMNDGVQWQIDTHGAHTSNDWEAYAPDHQNWTKAYAYVVNHHVRFNPIGSRLLAGDNPANIVDWLQNDSEGRKFMDNIGTAGAGAADIVDRNVAMVKHLIPGDMPDLRAILQKRDISQGEVKSLFPLENGRRMEVNGQDAALGIHGGVARTMAGKAVGALMKTLSTDPHETLARHPLREYVYTRQLRQFFGMHTEAELGDSAVTAALASARAKSTQYIHDYLMSNLDERQFFHSTRYVLPFYGAMGEITEKYIRLGLHDPSNIAKMNVLWNRMPFVGGNVWGVTDANGNPIQEGDPNAQWSPNNMFTFGDQSIIMKGLRQVIGTEAASKMTARIPFSMVDGVFREGGTNPLSFMSKPPIGYPIQFAAWEAIKDHPELLDKGGLGGALTKLLFPMGPPKNLLPDLGTAGQVATDLAPTWLKRLGEGYNQTLAMNDPAFTSLVTHLYLQQKADWEAAGSNGTAPSEGDSLKDALNIYRARGLTSLLSPFAPSYQVKSQGLIDLYHSLQGTVPQDQLDQRWVQVADKQYPSLTGGGKMQLNDNTYWDLWPLVHESGSTSNGLLATDYAMGQYSKYKDLIDKAANVTGGTGLLFGILSGSVATGGYAASGPNAFSTWIDNAQANTNDNAAPGGTLRSIKDPAAEATQLDVSRGWAMYSALAGTKDRLLREQVAAGGSSNIRDYPQIQGWYKSQIVAIENANPEWKPEFESHTKVMGPLMTQAYSVIYDQQRMSSDKNFATRADLVGLREYLSTREAFVQALQKSDPNFRGLKFDQTAGDAKYGQNTGAWTGPLAQAGQAWGDYVNRLVGQNTAFANVFYRYFQSDNLSITALPSGLQNAGPTMQQYVGKTN